MTKETRPSIVTNEHLIFLDDLRESGDTNMYGAGPYLREEFPDLSKTDSHKVLSYWMHSFTERHQSEKSEM